MLYMDLNERKEQWTVAHLAELGVFPEIAGYNRNTRLTVVEGSIPSRPIGLEAEKRREYIQVYTLP